MKSEASNSMKSQHKRVESLRKNNLMVATHNDDMYDEEQSLGGKLRQYERQDSTISGGLDRSQMSGGPAFHPKHTN